MHDEALPVVVKLHRLPARLADLRNVQVHGIESHRGDGFANGAHRRGTGTTQGLLRYVELYREGNMHDVAGAVWGIMRLRLSQGKGTPALLE
jgi:hypothetical protein